MGYLFLVLAMTLNAAANVMIKFGAARLGAFGDPGFVGRAVTNLPLIAGIGLFALNLVFYTAALSRLNLSLAYPVMMAGGVLIVVTLSVLFLREALSLTQMAGLLLLVVGLVLLLRQPAG